jgi:predicted acylesterase/phospholipase RssA
MPVKKIIQAVLPGRGGTAPSGPAGKRINLALQGGGAHGAFTWGVLEHLLGDDRLVIEGVSGTSSGAMNAIMLTDGLARGGCSAPSWSGFWRLRRSRVRRCRPGST